MSHSSTKAAERPVGVRALRFLGIAAAVLAWAVIAVSVAINRWFSPMVNPFSDLGGPRATDPWVYNYGMISVGALIIAFGSYVIYITEEKLLHVAASFMFVAGLFLALVGVFHEGTYPHVFVSQWFFAQMDMTALAWGLGSIVKGRAKTGLAELAIGVVGPLGAVLVRWPPGALIEAYGIILIDAFVALATVDISRR